MKNVTFAGSYIDNNRTQHYRIYRANLQKLFSKLKILLLLNSSNTQGEAYMITKISISEVWLIWACKKKAGNVRFSNIYHILCYITVTTIYSLDHLPYLAQYFAYCRFLEKVNTSIFFQED